MPTRNQITHHLRRHRRYAAMVDALERFAERIDQFCGGKGSKKPGPCPKDRPHVEAKAKATAAHSRAEHHARRLTALQDRHKANPTRATAAAIERHQAEHHQARGEALHHEQRARRLEASHRREEHLLKTDHDVQSAVREGRRAGIRPEHLRREAAMELAHDREHKEGLKTMLQDARQHAKALGTNLNTVRARNARGIDADQVRGLDDVAQSMQASYPEYFPHGVDPEERLFDLLSQGNPRPMSRGEAYERALDRLMTRRKRELADVPFSERRTNRRGAKR